jgi:hypothetical protein
VTYTLYRMRARRGELLYVGQSIRLPQRIKEHRKSKLWWESVDCIELEHFQSQEALDDAERRAIIFGRPLHNKMWSALDFSPIVLPPRHPALTQPDVPRCEVPRILGTDGITVGKAVRAKILQTEGRRVRARSVVEMWMSVAPVGTLIQQLITSLPEKMTGRSRALCWMIGDYIADELDHEETLNLQLDAAGVPKYPWAMSAGNIR